ncbi:hypothetical protein FA95DRAFT_1564452, partial [Auriscalpium vulgare]
IRSMHTSNTPGWPLESLIDGTGVQLHYIRPYNRRSLYYPSVLSSLDQDRRHFTGSFAIPKVAVESRASPVGLFVPRVIARTLPADWHRLGPRPIAMTGGSLVTSTSTSNTTGLKSWCLFSNLLLWYGSSPRGHSAGSLDALRTLFDAFSVHPRFQITIDGRSHLGSKHCQTKGKSIREEMTHPRRRQPCPVRRGNHAMVPDYELPIQTDKCAAR